MMTLVPTSRCPKALSSNTSPVAAAASLSFKRARCALHATPTNSVTSSWTDASSDVFPNDESLAPFAGDWQPHQALQALIDVGFLSLRLRGAGFSWQELKDHGFPAFDLVSAGCTHAELRGSLDALYEQRWAATCASFTRPARRDKYTAYMLIMHAFS